MSTDHHLEDDADDQVRDSRRDIHELEQIQQQLREALPPTPEHIRGRHPSTSAIAGCIAGRDLAVGDHLHDLVGPPETLEETADAPEVSARHQVVRVVGAPIAAGQQLEVRADGRVYPVDDEAGELAEQLVDVAETAAAADQVEQALEHPAPDYDFAEAIAGMANRHLQEAGLALEVVEACAGCGCTNRRACILENPRSIGGGMHVRTCHWIQTPPGQPPRCSKCGPTDEALEQSPATIMGIRVHRDDEVPPGEVELRDRLTGAVVARITNIEAPSAAEVDQAMQLLVPGEEHPIPYAAAHTISAERVGDDETALEARARRRS
jgi:hypothetical protein